MIDILTKLTERYVPKEPVQDDQGHWTYRILLRVNIIFITKKAVYTYRKVLASLVISYYSNLIDAYAVVTLSYEYEMILIYLFTLKKILK